MEVITTAVTELGTVVTAVAAGAIVYLTVRKGFQILKGLFN